MSGSSTAGYVLNESSELSPHVEMVSGGEMLFTKGSLFSSDNPKQRGHASASMLYDLFCFSQKRLDERTMSDLIKVLPLDEDRAVVEQIEGVVMLEYLKQIISYLVKSKIQLETQMSSYIKPQEDNMNEYEGMLQQLEAECRQHIRIEQQLKICAETTQDKLDVVQRDVESKESSRKTLEEQLNVISSNHAHLSPFLPKALTQKYEESILVGRQREERVKSLKLKVVSLEEQLQQLGQQSSRAQPLSQHLVRVSMRESIDYSGIQDTEQNHPTHMSSFDAQQQSQQILQKRSQRSITSSEEVFPNNHGVTYSAALNSNHPTTMITSRPPTNRENRVPTSSQQATVNNSANKHQASTCGGYINAAMKQQGQYFGGVTQQNSLKYSQEVLAQILSTNNNSHHQKQSQSAVSSHHRSINSAREDKREYALGMGMRPSVESIRKGSLHSRSGKSVMHSSSSNSNQSSSTSTAAGVGGNCQTSFLVKSLLHSSSQKQSQSLSRPNENSVIPPQPPSQQYTGQAYSQRPLTASISNTSNNSSSSGHTTHQPQQYPVQLRSKSRQRFKESSSYQPSTTTASDFTKNSAAELLQPPQQQPVFTVNSAIRMTEKKEGGGFQPARASLKQEDSLRSFSIEASARINHAAVTNKSTKQ